MTWQCGGESEESGFFGGFLDGEETGIEVHPGQTNGGCQINSNQYGDMLRFDKRLHVKTLIMWPCRKICGF